MPNNFKRHLSERRLARVPRYLGICGVSWAIYSAYFFATGRSFTMWLCVLESLLALSLIVVAQRKPKLRELIAHLNIFAAGSGMVVESLSSGGLSSSTPVFLACLPVLASHQLGVKAAMGWTFAAVAAVLMSFYGYDPATMPIRRIPHHFDRTLLVSGAAVVMYALSWQAERSFEKQVAQLVYFADGLQERSRLLRLAEQTAGVGHWQLDLNDGTFRLSEHSCELCGVDEFSGVGVSFEEFTRLLSEEDRAGLQAKLDSAISNPEEFKIQLEFTDGEVVRQVTCGGFSETRADGMTHTVFGVLKDESESHRAQQDLLALATLDPLTQLPNRHSFQLYLQEALKEADETGTRVALQIIDMDGFKQINDTLGHPVGDEILKLIADRLKESVGDSNYVARLGGDEFILVQRNLKTNLDVSIRGGKIARHVGKPYECSGKQLHVSASIGAAIYPDDTRDPDELLSFADTAMYRTKGSGDEFGLYDAAMTTDLVARHEIENRLVGALENNEFSLMYQPQVTMDQQIIGFEALVRWNRDGETVSPLDFIPLLESSGRIVEVGRWILNEACRQTKVWNDAGYDVDISVNISPVQFGDANFVPHLWGALEQTGLSAAKLDLELTESVLVDEITEIAMKLDLIKTTGINISIDDFGTGYSSLAYLKHLPIDRLKIDRAFIKDVPHKDDGTIAKSMIMMAQSLGLTTLAEGVETVEHLNFLREHGCEQYQGYLFSKPLTPEDAESLLSELMGASTRGSVQLLDLSLPDVPQSTVSS